MKKTNCLFCISILCLTLPCGIKAQSLLFDDFNGTSIDTNLFEVLLPYGDSSVTEGGGVVSIENNGRLTTQIASPSNYSVTGSFLMANNPYSNFKIVLRTDGTLDASEAKGIAFQFNIEDDNGTTTDNLRIFSIGNPAGDFTTPTVTANLTLNTWHSFVITDDGLNVALYFDGSLSPTLLTNSIFSVGNKITFYNRDGSGGGSSISANGITEIDYLAITNTGPIIGLIKSVKPTFSALSLGTNYQLQISSDLNTWTNQGSVFTATNSNMIYPQYFDVANWNTLFFRLQVNP